MGIDFETATARPTSACAVGLAGPGATPPKMWLIKPNPLEFHPSFVAVHGICETDVVNAPTFLELYEGLNSWWDGRVLVAHNARFDAKVLEACVAFAGLQRPRVSFVCSMSIARIVWPGLESYSLQVVCDSLSIPLEHHDPASDAAAALAIVARAEEKVGHEAMNTLFSQWHALGALGEATICAGCESLAGNRIAFTGTLLTMTRQEAFSRAKAAGAIPTESISKSLNILVLGFEAFGTYVSGQPSRKIRAARDLISGGASLELLSEQDFLKLL